MTIVYYHISIFKDGIACLILTEKAYWDANHALDDGSGGQYENISDAMRHVYMDEMAESTWELESPNNIGKIIAGMREHGFDLQANQAFSDFLNGQT